MGAGCQYERSVRVYGFATCTYVPAIRLDIGCTFVRVAITESQYSSLDSRFIYKQRLTPSTKEPSLQDIKLIRLHNFHKVITARLCSIRVNVCSPSPESVANYIYESVDIHVHM